MSYEGLNVILFNMTEKQSKFERIYTLPSRSQVVLLLWAHEVLFPFY